MSCRNGHAERCRAKFAWRTAAGLTIALLCWAGLLRADDRLDADVLQRVKRATVYLKVTLPDKSVVQGSGFFGFEPNLVVTNAHVLGMLRPESPKPVRVEVVINSGEKDEKTAVGEVLGVDRGSDLAVLRLQGKGLPEPLKVGSAKELRETDPVFIFGYPFGKQLGKNVTVNKSSVSSLRKDEKGLSLQQVQVNGGMNPGNSGGPVVDGKGQVVGVAVSGIRSTAINFAVPADQVHSFLGGRTWVVVTGLPYKDADAIRLPVRVEMIDPLRRIRQVWYETWTGDAGKPREARLVKPEKQTGDSERTKVELTFKEGWYEGELTIPKLPTGKIFWSQVMYTGQKTNSWRTAYPYGVPLPLERKPVVLKYQHQPGTESKWKLTSSATLKIRDEDDVDHPLAINLVAELTAATAKNLDADKAAIQLKMTKLEVTATFDKKPLSETEIDEKLLEEAKLIGATLNIGSDGKVLKSTADLQRIPRLARKRWEALAERLLRSLETVAVALPGEQVTYAKPWNETRPLYIGSIGPADLATADISHSYLGTRQRGGREEAILELAGVLRSRANKGVPVDGRLKGDVLIDLATGQLLVSHATIDLDFSLVFDGKSARAGGTLDVRLERGLPGK